MWIFGVMKKYKTSSGDVRGSVAYPELVSRGVSKSRKCNWLVKVGASNGVTPPLIKTKSWQGLSGQPENPPGYATEDH